MSSETEALAAALRRLRGRTLSWAPDGYYATRSVGGLTVEWDRFPGDEQTAVAAALACRSCHGTGGHAVGPYDGERCGRCGGRGVEPSWAAGVPQSGDPQ